MSRIGVSLAMLTYTLEHSLRRQGNARYGMAYYLKSKANELIVLRDHLTCTCNTSQSKEFRHQDVFSKYCIRISSEGYCNERR